MANLEETGEIDRIAHVTPELWLKWLVLLDDFFAIDAERQIERTLLNLAESTKFNYLTAEFQTEGGSDNGCSLLCHTLALKVYTRAASRLASHMLAEIAHMLARALQDYLSCENIVMKTRIRGYQLLSEKQLTCLPEPAKSLWPYLFELYNRSEDAGVWMVARPQAEAAQMSGLPLKQIAAMREYIRKSVLECCQPKPSVDAEAATREEICIVISTLMECGRWLSDDFCTQLAAQLFDQWMLTGDVLSCDVQLPSWAIAELVDACVPLLGRTPKVVSSILDNVDINSLATLRNMQIRARLNTLYMACRARKALGKPEERQFYYVKICGEPFALSQWRLALSFEYQPNVWVEFIEVQDARQGAPVEARVYGAAEPLLFCQLEAFRRWLMNTIASSALGEAQDFLH